MRGGKKQNFLVNGSVMHDKNNNADNVDDDDICIVYFSKNQTEVRTADNRNVEDITDDVKCLGSLSELLEQSRAAAPSASSTIGTLNLLEDKLNTFEQMEQRVQEGVQKLNEYVVKRPPEPEDSDDVQVISCSSPSAATQSSTHHTLINKKVYVKVSDSPSWKIGRVEGIFIQPDQPVRFRVKVNSACSVTVSGRKLALYNSIENSLPIGTSVIANPEKTVKLFFSGIILECPKPQNNGRYLVLFDRGDARYMIWQRIRKIYDLPITQSSRKYRKFVQCYIKDIPYPKMVEVQPGEDIRVLCQGNWYDAQVTKVYCSVAEVGMRKSKVFSKTSLTGLRIIPVFRSPYFIQKETTSEQDVVGASSRPSVSNTNSIASASFSSSSMRTPTLNKSSSARAIARKSTGGTRSLGIRSVRTGSVGTGSVGTGSMETGSVGTGSVGTGSVGTRSVGTPTYKVVKDISLPMDIPRPKKLTKHNCTPKCISWIREKEQTPIFTSPLVYPLLHGWERKVKNEVVNYRAPCGKVLRGMRDICRFLRSVKSNMSIDMFDVHVETRPLSRFLFDEKYVLYDDLSEGKEEIPISVYNDIDCTLPSEFEYWPSYYTTCASDPKFLATCDCEDDCRDWRRCSCAKYSYEEMKLLYENTAYECPKYTYRHRRLHQRVETGMFECNNWCKCSSTCGNRVAQNPIRLDLQVYKTRDKGWGVRCLHDVPVGAFICTYAGELLTNEEANIQGEETGDTYFVELDHCEVVRRAYKDGYESEVECDPDSEDEPRLARKRASEEELGGGKKSKHSSLTVETPSLETGFPQLSDTGNFVVDGKRRGNVARFFNHSCDPNMFAQNVFVDTHDLRLPRVALFAAVPIPAGTELTWDYGYVANSVPGKNIGCNCGSFNCDGRLL